jgi:hypothetical protein
MANASGNAGYAAQKSRTEIEKMKYQVFHFTDALRIASGKAGGIDYSERQAMAKPQPYFMRTSFSAGSLIIQKNRPH